MGWPRHHGPDDLDRTLSALPAPHLVRRLGNAHFVLGPSGAHVVALDDGSESAPRDIARLAALARSALADRTAWVPFIEPFLVTERTEPCPPATRVPLQLIPGSLIDGPPHLTTEQLARLVACIEDGALDDLDAVAPAASRPLTAH